MGKCTMNQRMSAALDFLLIILVSLYNLGPVESQTSSNSTVLQNNCNGTNITCVPVTSCPGYERGSLLRRNMTGCETGTILDPIDHMTAFHFSRGENPDWNSCGLPYLPEENEKVCYKTAVDKCGDDYRIYLNYRNLKGLRRNCPHESNNLTTTTINGTDRILQSPRYGCRKGRGSGNYYNYRRSELCLYNISIPNCESGALIVESVSESEQVLEGRLRNDDGQIICTDYLQFYYGNSKTSRFCGDELSLRMPLVIPATQFMALFWTDPTNNKLGFKLVAKCAQEHFSSSSYY